MTIFWRKVASLFCLTALLSVVVFFPSNTNAQSVQYGPGSGGSTFSNLSQYASTLQSGTASDYEVNFTVTSFLFGSASFVWSFSSDFDITALTVGDLDFSGGFGDFVLGSDCSGGAEFSVTFNVSDVTLASCPLIVTSPGAYTIKAGTNASVGAVGTNQIVNPASVGTYFQSVTLLTPTPTESGSFVFPIGGDDSVNVTGVVPAAAPSGGGGGGGAIDVIAPNIFNVVVSGISETGATVSWQTDENSDTFLEFGLTTSYEMGTSIDTGLATSHVVNIGALDPGTLYHFRIKAKDQAGNQKISGDFTFTTSDTHLPVISNVQVIEISKTSARIIWTTSETTSGEVNYGLTTEYGSNTSEVGTNTDHSVVLTGLSFDTLYHFKVISVDGALNSVSSTDATFTTLNDPPPANVQNLALVAGDQKNTLSWTNPADVDLAGIRVLYCPNNFPVGPLDPACSILSSSIKTSFTHTSLTNGQIYYYGVFARDAAGQFSSGAIISGVPVAPVIPVPPPEDPIIPPGGDNPPIDVPPGGGGGAGSFCGDGICSVTENETSCPGDCKTPVMPFCGNNKCEVGESFRVCPVDCKKPEEVTPTPENKISLDQFSFFVLNGRLRLPSQGGVVRVLPNRPLRITLEPKGITSDIDRIEINLQGSVYLMNSLATRAASSGNVSLSALPTDVFEATINTPANLGSYPVEVTAFIKDGSETTANLSLSVLSEGVVFHTQDGSRVNLEGARVLLIDQNNNLPWDASSYEQFNPIITEQSGAYAWYVPEGGYKLKVEKTGFQPFETVLQASGRVVNTPVGLVLLDEISPITDSTNNTNNTDSPNVNSSDNPLIDAAIKGATAVNDVIESIRDIPGVQETATVSLPVISGATVASAAVLASSFNLVSFLQYLFTAPLLFFGRRRRKGFGVIYNAATKVPIDLATVRLFKLADGATDLTQSGRLVQSRVTNKQGQYYFLVQPGTYKLQVMKTGFVFPSVFAANRVKDDKYLDVYHGEIITVTGKEATVTANVPVDPIAVGALQEPKAIIWKRRLRFLQRFVAVGGVFVSLFVVVIQPSWFSAGLFVFQIALYLITKRLVTPAKPTNWGIVYDEKTKKPLAHVVARIFDPTYNKLLETQVTDSAGRFSFFLGPNEYYAVFQKKGYNEMEYRPIDYKTQKDITEFGPKVLLKPAPEQQ